ncbi:MAG: ResB protein required for cytochrome biosynthesis [Verrucomicrobiales bacterium]|nr:ResB protein required for cytochrome biosynthesis [Verrucomicrobiales bacterium]
MNKLIKILTSLRLTVVCLCFGIALVFIGTIAQVDEGLYQAQNRYFRSLLVFWSPTGSHLHIPIFPGGYLVGGLLLANLIAAHISRFKLTKNKIGILLAHFGLILLFIGQFATDIFSHESAMRLNEGESKNYSEAFRETELAIVDTSDTNTDRVIAVSESLLAEKKTIQSDKLPVTINVKNFWPNANLFRTPAIATNIPQGTILPKDLGVTGGDLDGYCVMPQPLVTDTEHRNIPAALVEFLDGDKSLGTYLLTAALDANQTLDINGKPYEVALRFEREYYPFSLTLLKATHEKYKGTDVPKNFASRIRLENPEKHEARETVIYMNNPLRYAGLTFFQYQMDPLEMSRATSDAGWSTFQVVRNPSWLTPYLACVLVALGLIIQFMMHLLNFATKRRNVPANAKSQKGNDAKKQNVKATQEVTLS